MASTAHFARGGEFAPRFPSVLVSAKAFFCSLARALDIRYRYSYLIGLSDEELADLGLTRQDLPRYLAGIGD